MTLVKLSLLCHPRTTQSEAFVGKIRRNNKPYPANPDGHHNVPDRHMPTAEQAKSVEESYQREKGRSDEREGSLRHFAPCLAATTRG